MRIVSRSSPRSNTHAMYYRAGLLTATKLDTYLTSVPIHRYHHKYSHWMKCICYSVKSSLWLLVFSAYWMHFISYEYIPGLSLYLYLFFNTLFSFLHVLFLAATKQLYEWYFLSDCLSVCLSVTPFWLCSHHRIITKFSGFTTNDRGDVHAKDQGQRSKVKVIEVTTQINRFRIVTPVWIHIWWWNHAYGLMIRRRGILLFFKVIRQISRSHGSKKRRIWPRLGVSGL